MKGGVGCSVSCRCEGCKNAFGRREGKFHLDILFYKCAKCMHCSRLVASVVFYVMYISDTKERLVGRGGAL